MYKKFPAHYSMTNPASVYDEESMTALEMCGRLANKVNEMIDALIQLDSETTQALVDQAQALKVAVEVTIPEAIRQDVQDHINGGTFARQINAYLNNLNERLDNFMSTVHAGSTSGDAELYDIRVDGSGYGHPSAGDAVRSLYADVHGALQTGASRATPGVVVGGVTNGEAVGHTGRMRFENLMPCHCTVITVASNPNFRVGWSVYDEDGNWDGVDHGWNELPVTIKQNTGFISLCFKRADEANVVTADLNTCRNLVTITESKVLRDLFTFPTDVMPVECEEGTFTNGEPEASAIRVRMTEKVRVTPKTRIMLNNRNITYGYAFYDEDGEWDGVDHGWTTTTGTTWVNPNKNGYIRFNFMNNEREHTPEYFAQGIHIYNEITPDVMVERLKALENKKPEAGGSCGCNADLTEFINSIEIQRGIYGGNGRCTYTLIRIPSTSVGGRAIRPNVRLAKAGGQSALEYAEEHGSLMTINAGLFNIPAMTPNGLLKTADGETNDTPMTDDNGTPIGAVTCYPLVICDGWLDADYGLDSLGGILDNFGENAQAVTGWGSVIYGFDNEGDGVIRDTETVHPGPYVRQIIGQFQAKDGHGNYNIPGDYFVLTVDGPSGEWIESAGMTYQDVQDLLIDEIGSVYFAYSLDGGGSCETVIGQKHVNPIYEGEKGRKVVTLITFDFV